MDGEPSLLRLESPDGLDGGEIGWGGGDRRLPSDLWRGNLGGGGELPDRGGEDFENLICEPRLARDLAGCACSVPLGDELCLGESFAVAIASPADKRGEVCPRLIGGVGGRGWLTGGGDCGGLSANKGERIRSSGGVGER